MPNNKRKTLKAMKDKNSLHPSSRKAGQLDRVHLRAAKLADAGRRRKIAGSEKFERPSFFQQSLSSPHPLTLASLRALISTVYLTRFDEMISSLESSRRKGRPKEKKQMELEMHKSVEAGEWETGFEVLDLTHSGTTRLLWEWVQADTPITASNLALLRTIRIAEGSDDIVVVRPGMTEKMGLTDATRPEVAEGEEPVDWAEEEGEKMVVE